MNWQLARYLFGAGLAMFADRTAQVQLLSLIVMSGPDGQGLGSNTLSLLLPFVLLAYLFGISTDKHSQRKLLIVTALARALFVIALPTVLTWLGAAGPIIPISVFLLSALSVLCDVINFAVIPRLLNGSRQLKRANALSILTITFATLLAVNSAAIISDHWLPHEILRFCASLYFLCAAIFWTMDRTRTAAIKRDSTSIEELSAFLQKKKIKTRLVRLALLTHIGYQIFYYLFLVFCLQNTQLTNALSLNTFTTIAAGFLIGAVSTLLLFNPLKATALIAYSAVVASANCLLFTLFASNELVIRALSATGIAGSDLFVRIFLLLMGTTGGITIAAVNSLLQRQTNPNTRAKVYGAILSLAAVAYTLTAVALEQITSQYSTVTILRGLAACWLIYACLAGLFSGAFKKMLVKSKWLDSAERAKKTASGAENK